MGGTNKDFDSFFGGGGQNNKNNTSTSTNDQIQSGFNIANTGESISENVSNLNPPSRSVHFDNNIDTNTGTTTGTTTDTTTGTNTENIHVDNSNNMFGVDDTPAILLEQLAYIDTFMPQLEEDLVDYSNTHMANTTTNNNTTSTSTSNTQSDNAQDVNSYANISNDRLAAELSVFADETFIFPDEDKHDFNDINNGNINALNRDLNGNIHAQNDNTNNNSNNTPQFPINDPLLNNENGHLPDRRNNMLNKQYDLTRKRISSKNQKYSARNTINNDSNRTPSFSSQNNTPDHGGFVNFDVLDHPTHTAQSPPPPLIASFHSPISQTNLPNASTFSQSALSSNSRQHSFMSPSLSSSSLSPDITSLSLKDLLKYMQASPQLNMKFVKFSKMPHNCYIELLQNHGFDDNKISAMLYIIEYYQSNYLNFTPINGSTRANQSHGNEIPQSNDSGIMSPQSNMKYQIYKESLNSTDVHSLMKSIYPDTMVENNHTSEALNGNATVQDNNTPTIDDYLMKIDEPASNKAPEPEKTNSQNASTQTQEQKTQDQHPPENNDNLSSTHVNTNDEPKTTKESETATAEKESKSIDKHSDSDTVTPSLAKTKEKPQKITKKTGSSSKPKVKKVDDLEGKISDLIKVSTELTQKVKDLEMENQLLKKLVTEKGQFNSVSEVEKLYNGNK
ncbi:hypothetical protein ACO0QE_001057 [Hanseniaspora vineae]